MKFLEFDSNSREITTELQTFYSIETANYWYTSFTWANTGATNLAGTSNAYFYEAIGAPESVLYFDANDGATLNNLALTQRYRFGVGGFAGSTLFSGFQIYHVSLLDWRSAVASGTTTNRIRGIMKGEREGRSIEFDSAAWTVPSFDAATTATEHPVFEPEWVAVFPAPASNNPGQLIIKCQAWESLGLLVENTSGTALTSFNVRFNAHPSDDVYQNLITTDIYTTSNGAINANLMQILQKCSPRSPFTLAGTGITNNTFLEFNVLACNRIRFNWTPTNVALRFRGVLKG